MTKSITLTQARNELLSLAQALQRHPTDVVEVTKRGKRVMTLLSSQLYEALIETLEIVGDEKATAELRRALNDAAAGRTIPWKKARARLTEETVSRNATHR